MPLPTCGTTRPQRSLNLTCPIDTLCLSIAAAFTIVDSLWNAERAAPDVKFFTFYSSFALSKKKGAKD